MNKAGRLAAESVERRAGTKGKAAQRSTRRAQDRESVSQALDRIRKVAKERKKEKFTALFHHLSLDLLEQAFFDLKDNAAPGVDGVTWSDYEADLERNLEDLFSRLHRGAYRAMPSRRRPDVRFLANGILTTVRELREIVIPVDPISGAKAAGKNSAGLRASLKHLRSGGMLVIFPAGEVSQFHLRAGAVTDAEWNPSAARIAGLARVPVVPAYVAGANSLLFQIAGMAHATLRTALLGRELLNKRGTRVEVRFGAPIAPGKLMAISTAREQTAYLRWRTYLLSSRETFKPATALPLFRRRAIAETMEPIAAPVPAAQLAYEIAAMPSECLLSRTNELEAYIARASEIPNVLRELGRLREITFRAAGEGTGKALDLDDFDVHYLHLFVWNPRKQELVGAYRLAHTETVRKHFGARGLYTATLFRYGNPFLDRLGPALELGRSFVRQEYQKGFSPLLLLWKAIGAYVAQHPECKTLFGPVSISNRYQAVSRELIVSFLEKYESLRDWAGLVRNRSALRERFLIGANRPIFPDSGFDIEDLSAVVGEIEQSQTGIPVLLRQYLKLGGKLLSFNVDPKFANALDGLILVDLTKTGPKLLERYFGERNASTFLAYQKGQNGTH